MFGTIRKHQKWLWLAIVIPTIITFVWYFGPAARVNSGSRRPGEFGSVSGHKISPAQYAEAKREVELHYFFNVNPGHWPDEDRRSGFDEDRQTYQWLLLLTKQKELGIHASPDVVADAARQMVRRFERQGITSPAMFIQQVLQRRGLQVDDFERFVEHMLGLEELMQMVGASGTLITPQEARELYQRDHQDLATEALFFSASNYVAEVATPAPPILSQFYSNMIVRYAVPERVQVSYVRFNVTNYFPEAEAELNTNGVDNLAAMVENNYQRLGTNILLVFPDAKTPEAVKARIREELIRKQAMTDAGKKAMTFANELFTMQPMRPENLQTLAASNGLTVAVSQPFDREEGPKDLDAGADFTKRAFELSADEPFTQPTPGRDGIYIAAFNKQLPRETPSLDKIHDRVVADYKHDEAMRLAQKAAAGFYQTLTNGLAQGSTFTNLCNLAKLKPTPLPPFSLATRDLPSLDEKIDLNLLKQVAFTTPVGKVSPPREIADGTFILYVAGKLPIDPAKMQTDLPGYTVNLRRNRQQEAFEDWFRREADRGLRDVPLLKQRNGNGPGGPAAAS